MAGYTDGVAKSMSKDSMNGDLFLLDNSSYVKACAESYEMDLKELLSGGYYEGDDYTATLSDDGKSVRVEQDPLTFIDENSQGGLQYIIDSNGDFLGARLGVCGEHIGSVSVWLDTQKGVLEQDGQTYPISDEDCDTLNEYLEELSYDAIH